MGAIGNQRPTDANCINFEPSVCWNLATPYPQTPPFPDTNLKNINNKPITHNSLGKRKNNNVYGILNPLYQNPKHFIIIISSSIFYLLQIVYHSQALYCDYKEFSVWRSFGRPTAPSPPSPVKPFPPSPPPPTTPPPPPSSSSPAPVRDQNVISLEFQRKKAKELQDYFKQKKLEESNQGPFFGFIGKNEIGNGRYLTQYPLHSFLIV